MLENHHLATHALIIALGDEILFEHYTAPFHKDFSHRIYSSTKSFTSLAVGFAEQDGLLDVNEKLCKYFPEESKDVTNQDILALTVKNLLMMRTAGRVTANWFEARTNDRVAHYFKNRTDTRRPDTEWEYDSNGSFILCALVERVTGKDFMEYMRENITRPHLFLKRSKDA